MKIRLQLSRLRALALIVVIVFDVQAMLFSGMRFDQPEPAQPAGFFTMRTSGPIEDALDTVLTITTGGNAPCFPETTYFQNGGDAIQTGDIGDNQSSWIETSVSGTGMLRFYWSVSSEKNWDFLSIYVDDVCRDRFSGTVLWEERTVYINTTGTHTLTWKYEKDDMVSSGSDCGWIDYITWTEISLPSAPRNLISTRGNSSVNLLWNVPLDDGGLEITNYTLYRGILFGAESYLLMIGNICTYIDEGLQNGQVYYYLVRAVTALGEGDNSTQTFATPATLPGEPRNLHAFPGNNSVYLEWQAPIFDGGSSILNYIVYRGTAPAAETELVTLENRLNFTDTLLANGQTYYYQIIANNSIGDGLMSQEVNATPADVPSSPRNVQAVVGNGYLHISWLPPLLDGGVIVLNYSIYRGLAPGQETWIRTVANTVTTFNDTGLVNGQSYYYRISAFNWMGEGVPSPMIYATPATFPGVPQNVRASRSNETVHLEWDIPLEDGGSNISNYRIYYGTISGNLSSSDTIGNVRYFSKSGLVNGQIYFWRVGAINSVGEGSLSTQVNATPAMVPTQPMNFSGIAGNGHANITWEAPLDDGGFAITGYNIYKGITSGNLSLNASIGVQFAFTNAGLPNGVIYYYAIAAVNSIGESSWAGLLALLPAGPPTAPVNASASRANQQITVSWNTPLSAEGATMSGYNIYRSLSPGTEEFLIATGLQNQYTDGNLTNGIRYYYTVTAVNAIGESTFSSETSAVPAAVPPGPRNVTTVQGNGFITVSWLSPANDEGAAILGYKLYKSTTANVTETWIALGNVTNYTDSFVVAGQVYFYAITAINAEGEGSMSDVINITAAVVPGAPVNLQVESGPACMLLSWEVPDYDGNAPILSYRIYWRISWSQFQYLTTVTTSLSFNDTAWHSNGFFYYYHISAVNVAGEGAFSNESSAMFDGILPFNPTSCLETNYYAPSGSWHALGGNPHFAWSGASDSHSGISGYLFYWGMDENGTGTFFTNQTWIEPATIAGGAYYLRVRTVDNAGNMAAWQTLFVFKYDNSPPTSPIECYEVYHNVSSGIWHNITDGYFDFRFSGAVDGESGVFGYNLYFGLIPNGTSTLWSWSRWNGTANVGRYEYSAFGMLDGKYYLRASTVDHAGFAAPWITIFEFMQDTTPPVSFVVTHNLTQAIDPMSNWHTSMQDIAYSWPNATDTLSGFAGFNIEYGDARAPVQILNTSMNSLVMHIHQCGRYIIIIDALDAAGNVIGGIGYVSSLFFDWSKPVSTIFITGNETSPNTYDGPINITITMIDDYSGDGSIQCWVNNKQLFVTSNDMHAWQEDYTHLVLTEQILVNGVNRIEFYSVDKARNQEETHVLVITIVNSPWENYVQENYILQITSIYILVVGIACFLSILSINDDLRRIGQPQARKKRRLVFKQKNDTKPLDPSKIEKTRRNLVSTFLLSAIGLYNVRIAYLVYYTLTLDGFETLLNHIANNMPSLFPGIVVVIIGPVIYLLAFLLCPVIDILLFDPKRIKMSLKARIITAKTVCTISLVMTIIAFLSDFFACNNVSGIGMTEYWVFANIFWPVLAVVYIIALQFLSYKVKINPAITNAGNVDEPSKRAATKAS